MSTLTTRLLADKHARRHRVTEDRSISVNKPVEEMAVLSLTESDAWPHFRVLLDLGSEEKGFTPFDTLDEAFAA